MKYLWSAVPAAILFITSAAFAVAPETADLRNDPKTTGDVTTYGMGYGLQRHSPLRKLNTSNVKNLVPVWNLSLSNNNPQSQQPLLIDGVMYVATNDSTVAINALSGRQIWKAMIDYPADANAVACCGIHNRGVAAYRGKLFRGTLDAHVIALDMKTGKELWRQKTQDYKEGYSITVAPLVANGVVITGMSGGEFGTRGFLNGWDPETGKQLWWRYTVPAPTEKGGDTWKGDTYLKGGAPTWLTGSYDPEFDLVYWGTGNGGPWNPSARPGDNLYVASVLAIRPKTGEIVWYYQFSPNDPYDYDGTNELIHADLKVNGKLRKVIMQANRNGYFYVLDRTNGELISVNPFIDKINWAKGVDRKTGRPIDSELTAMIRKTPVMEKPVDIWPSALGGKNWSPMSYDPKLGLAFANTLNFGMPYQTVEPKYIKGQWYLGMNFAGLTWPENGKRGYLKAIEPLTGKAKWQVPLEIPNLAGTLSTDGNLLFTGTLTGEFVAYDSRNGKKLWSFQTGSGIVSMPITWEKDGKQYVTVTSGTGGVYLLFSGDERLKNVPTGGSVWTFALK